MPNRELDGGERALAKGGKGMTDRWFFPPVLHEGQMCSVHEFLDGDHTHATARQENQQCVAPGLPHVAYYADA